MSGAVPAGVPTENITVAPREPHMELFDPRTRDVWLCQQPVTADEFRDFRCEPPLVKAGLGRAAFDRAWFRRSPGAAADGPLERREIGGRPFVRVARPRDFSGLARGDAPTELRVEKSHVLGYAAGRELGFACLPDGRWLVEHTASADGAVIAPPADWRLVRVTLAADWDCELSGGVDVYFFRNLQSYAGPLDPAELPPGVA